MQLKDKICFDLMGFIRKTPNEVVIPNFYFGFYEMDVFRMTPNGYVSEYEIKTSRADFKNDFKKSRTVSFSKKIGDNTEVLKHEEIEKGSHKANKFFFVVPEGMVKVEEIPKNCGLIYYKSDSYSQFEVVKAASFINKRNFFEDGFQDLVKSLSYREFAIRAKNNRLMQRIEAYKKGKIKIGEVSAKCEKCKKYFPLIVQEQDQQFEVEESFMQTCKCGHKNKINLIIKK